MLLLGSKSMTIDGITVFFDHADPAQFWYLPGPVRIARRREDDRASFTFIKYKPAAVAGGAKGGGFVTFEVNLKLDTEQERRILSKLRSVSRGKPKLALVPFDEGTVQCIALNIQGAGGTAAAAATEGTFNAVEKILGASVPSLHGDNSAAFSLTLSQEGATILEEAFKKGTSPIGVIYDLKFTGMRPALNVKITADFKRVYDQFSASLNAQVYFVQAGIDAGFEKLVQDGVIKIEVMNFTGDADLKDQQTWALNFFKDTLLNDWFKPTLTPGQLAGGGAQAGSLDDVLRRGTQMRPAATTAPPARGTSVAPPANHGPSPTAGMGPRDEHAYPFVAPMAAAAARPARQNTTGSTTGTPPTPAVGVPPTPSVGVPPPSGGGPTTGTEPTVTTPTVPTVSPTEGLGVPTVTTPPNTSEGVPAGNSSAGANAISAASSATPFAVSFKLKFVKQEELKKLTFEYNLQEAAQRTYAPQGFFGLLLADLSKENHFIEVDLDDAFFRVFTVTAEAPIDFARIGLQSLQVALDYGNKANATDHKHGDFVFDAVQKDARKFEVFMNKTRDTAYNYNVQYHFDPLSEWEGAKFSYEIPVKLTEDRTLMLNPFNDIGFLEIKIKPHKIDAGVVESTDVFLNYDDGAGFKKDKTITVLSDSPEQSWKLRIPSNAGRGVSYRLVHHLKDRSKLEMPVVTTKATTIFVDDPFPEALELKLIPSFDETAVRQAFIDIEYKDDANSYSRNEHITIKNTETDIVPLRISLMDNKKKTFRYRITMVGRDGKIQQNPFVETDNEFIQVA
jgi:hypothetical protein